MDINPEDNKNGLPPTIKFIRNLPPFLYVIIVLGLIFFLYQVIGASIVLAAGGKDIDSNVQLMRIILSFGQFMFILAPTLFFIRLQTDNLKGTLRLNIPNPLLILLAILGIFLIQPVLQGYMSVQNYVLDNIPLIQEPLKQLKSLFDLVEQTTMKIVRAYSPAEFAVVVFVISITPAVCEEILFRGFVLKNLERTAKPGAAIFLTGFLFALYHLEPFNLIALILLGFFLSFVVYYSNSIYTGMLCHFLNNFFASFFLYKYGKEDIEAPSFSGSEVLDTAVIALGSLVLLVLVILMFYKLRYKKEAEEV